LLCTLLVALPPGWCCVLVPAACCGNQQPVEQRGAPVKHKSCCCAAKPTQNGSQPKPKGGAPVKSCSCEKPPNVPSDTARFGPDLLALGFVRTTQLAHFSVTEPIQSGRTSPALSPPLHVSHCVWLC
jgi:hypothetical protein